MLAYNYVANSNRLAKVTDSVIDATSRLGDFKDGANGGDDYTYNVQGSMYSDEQKGIASITYTWQQLPIVVALPGKGTITYMYDWNGNKLRKDVVDSTVNPVKTTKWMYANGFVYRNDTLEYFSHAEGKGKI